MGNLNKISGHISFLVNKFHKLAKVKTTSVTSYGFKTSKRWAPSKGPTYLNDNVLSILKEAENSLPEGYKFLILGGLRSLKDQTKLVKKMEKELKKSNPNDWQKLLNKYTGGYDELKLNNYSYMNHLSGNAIDITLSLNGKEVDMGLDSDGNAMMSEKDKIDYYKKATIEKEKEINNNRKILKNTLKKFGFENYKDEWWHWGLNPEK